MPCLCCQLGCLTGLQTFVKTITVCQNKRGTDSYKLYLVHAITCCNPSGAYAGVLSYPYALVCLFPVTFSASFLHRAGHPGPVCFCSSQRIEHRAGMQGAGPQKALVRVRGHFLQTSCATGRIAMDEPNLQTVPKPYELDLPAQSCLQGTRCQTINIRSGPVALHTQGFSLVWGQCILYTLHAPQQFIEGPVHITPHAYRSAILICWSCDADK